MIDVALAGQTLHINSFSTLPIFLIATNEGLHKPFMLEKPPPLSGSEPPLFSENIILDVPSIAPLNSPRKCTDTFFQVAAMVHS